jgi:DNA polymerase (family 10)/putative hydrolase
MKYIDHLSSGQWHIHTNYSDGKDDISDYCRRAVEIGIPLIAFTEHVRRNLSYNFNSFLEDIEAARNEFDIIILSGCEAKVLPSGRLDVDDHVLKAVDYPIFSFHSFPEDLVLYVECLKMAIKNPYVNAWAHPGTLSYKKIDLPKNELAEIFSLMVERGVLLEINRKYDLPTERWLRVAKDCGVKMVKGSDVHQIADLI